MPQPALPLAIAALPALLLSAGLAWAILPANRPAPDFTLQSTVGANLRLSEQRGKVVVVNFFTSACGPCRAQMTLLNQLAERHKPDGLLVLGVSLDDDSSATVTTMARLGIHYPLLLDREKQVSRAYQLLGVPSTVLIDRDGRIRHAHRDYHDAHAALYEQQIKELLRP